MADPDPTPIKRRQGFATWSPERRAEAQRRAAETRARKKANRPPTAKPKDERRPKGRAPNKKDLEAVIALLVGGVAGREDYTDPTDHSAQAEQVRAAIERIRSWCPQPDRLERFETEMVADVTADELIKRPRLVEPFLRLLERGKDFKLLAVILAIAIPRLVNHGAIPAFIGRLVYAPILSAAGRRGAVDFEPEPEPEPPPPAPEPESGGSIESE